MYLFLNGVTSCSNTTLYLRVIIVDTYSYSSFTLNVEFHCININNSFSNDDEHFGYFQYFAITNRYLIHILFLKSVALTV